MGQNGERAGDMVGLGAAPNDGNLSRMLSLLTPDSFLRLMPARDLVH